MVPGADRTVDALRTRVDGNEVQFKMGPTPGSRGWAGCFVATPSMSCLSCSTSSLDHVAGRPAASPSRGRWSRYGLDMRRRLLVKPGIAGLWQVGGQSDLSWDDWVRSDLRYVENWSLSFDLMILGKTVGAVIRGPGAY